ncbi:MAG: preprotein translocase subunit SecY, partial [Candidatus Korarchaeota archaeon]
MSQEESEKIPSLGVMGAVSKIMFEIKKPDRKVSFREKIGWTAVILIFYLIMSELPLYGVAGGGYDYLYWSRLILASSRGTVLELGIGPIVTAGLIMQLLVGSEMIKWDFSDPVDRKKFSIAQKFLSLILAAVQAGMFIFAKAFGELSLLNAIMVFFQLFVASYIVLLLDEAIQKGWGIGSGISLFIAAGVAKSIFWGSFSVVQSYDGYAQGAVIQFFQSLWDGKGLYYAFFR